MGKAFNAMDLILYPWLSFYDYWQRLVSERESSMRRYIRHPSDIPIAFKMGPLNTHSEKLRDVSRGGLCFSSDSPVQIGSSIHIEIPVQEVPFEADGTVAWCRSEGNGYSVGVEFNDTSTRFSVRMIEQICHIEHYKTQVAEEEGRFLSSEEAAKEWVEKYAADFPTDS